MRNGHAEARTLAADIADAGHSGTPCEVDFDDAPEVVPGNPSSLTRAGGGGQTARHRPVFGKYPSPGPVGSDGEGSEREGATVLEALDADALRAWSNATVDLIDAHRAEIDALNV